jgi:hypothetical protein
VSNEQVKPTADDGDDKTKHHVGTDYQRRRQGCEAQERYSAQGAGAGGRYTDFNPYDSGNRGKPSGAICRSCDIPLSKRSIKVDQ